MSDTRDLIDMPMEESRERIIKMLEDHYAFGHLTLTQYENRLSVATNTESKGDLIPLVLDLPSLPGSPVGNGKGGPAKDREVSVDSSSLSVNRGAVRESGAIVGFLSGISRKGVWRPPRNLNVTAVLAGVELDFRQAELPPGETVVDVFCLLGGVEIKVPPDLNVEVEGTAVLGGFEDRSRGSADRTGPVLRITGFALLGGVDVKVKRKTR